MAKKHLDTATKHVILGGLSAHRETEKPLELLQKVRGITPNHRAYLKAIDNSKLTFCLGPAGTGKTWQAAGKASAMLVSGEINKIVITRPMVPCGRDRIGFLPGDKNAKVSPHMRPLLDAFDDFLGEKTVDRLVESEVIVMSPLELMRGSNIRDSFIICDEAQNVEFVQLRMFLTRFAKGSKVVVTGDETQTDLPGEGENPLMRAINLFRPNCHTDIAMVSLGYEDVMRDELTSWIDQRLGSVVHNKYPSTPTLVEQCSEPGFVEDCQWCCSQCEMRDESAIQFECWTCGGLTDIDLDNELTRTTIRNGACSKTFCVNK